MARKQLVKSSFLARYALTALLSLAIIPAVAQAGSLSLMGGGDWSRVMVNSAPASGGSEGTGAQPGYGGGMLLNFDFAGGPFSFETGGLYMHHKEAFGGGTFESNQVDIPVDLRLWLGRVLSFGAGGYYAIGVGNTQEAAPGVLTQNDYGALGSVRLQIPLSDSTNFLINGNYLYGLKDVNDNGDGTDLRTRELQGLVGLSFDW